MNYLDHVARLAALEAAAAAQAIFDQRPNLTDAERKAVIGRSLVQARHDYLDSYIRSEADAAFRRAIDEVCTELGSGSIALSDEHESADDENEFGLSPKAAARLLADKRRSGQ